MALLDETCYVLKRKNGLGSFQCYQVAKGNNQKLAQVRQLADHAERPFSKKGLIRTHWNGLNRGSQTRK